MFFTTESTLRIKAFLLVVLSCTTFVHSMQHVSMQQAVSEFLAERARKEAQAAINSTPSQAATVPDQQHQGNADAKGSADEKRQAADAAARTEASVDQYMVEFYAKYEWENADSYVGGQDLFKGHLPIDSSLGRALPRLVVWGLKDCLMGQKILQTIILL